MASPRVAWDFIVAPSYLVLFEGLAYPVQIAYSLNVWTLWVDLPQEKPRGWPDDAQIPVPDICVEWKGAVLQDGKEQLRRNIDTWIRSERPFKGDIPKSQAQMKEEADAAEKAAEAKANEPAPMVHEVLPAKRGPGRPKVHVL
jgi:hypothetical protein